MSDNSVIYDPMNGQWSLSDGEHFLTVPHWARGVIADAYEREVSPLKAENEKLFALLKHESEQTEKLRELVRAAWRCIHTGASCSDCRLVAGGCTLQSAMRELGVDDG